MSKRRNRRRPPEHIPPTPQTVRKLRRDVIAIYMQVNDNHEVEKPDEVAGLRR